MLGRGNKVKRMLDKKILKNAAYHEAGHTVVWHMNGFCVDELSINNVAADGGECTGSCHVIEPMIHHLYPGCFKQFKKQRNTYHLYKKRAERWINGLLAGPLAEKKISKSRTPLYSKEIVTHGGGNDFKEAIYLAREFYNEDEIGVYLQLSVMNVQKLLRGKNIWTSVIKLAATLLDKRKIAGDELRKYLNDLPVNS